MPDCSVKWWYQFTRSPAVYESFCHMIHSTIHRIISLFVFSQLDVWVLVSHSEVNLHFPRLPLVEYLFIIWLAMLMSSVVNCLSKLFVYLSPRLSFPLHLEGIFHRFRVWDLYYKYLIPLRGLFFILLMSFNKQKFLFLV